MPFDMDVLDADWRAELSEEQLDALERRQASPTEEPPTGTRVLRVAVRRVGAERARLVSRGARVE